MERKNVVGVGRKAQKKKYKCKDDKQPWSINI